jgi:hypothetical protein
MGFKFAEPAWALGGQPWTLPAHPLGGVGWGSGVAVVGGGGSGAGFQVGCEIKLFLEELQPRSPGTNRAGGKKVYNTAQTSSSRL